MTNDAVEGELEVWRWYCRIDGAEGEAFTPKERDDAAMDHAFHTCAAAGKPNLETREVGHLLHVWSW